MREEGEALAANRAHALAATMGVRWMVVMVLPVCAAYGCALFARRAPWLP